MNNSEADLISTQDIDQIPGPTNPFSGLDARVTPYKVKSVKILRKDTKLSGTPVTESSIDLNDPGIRKRGFPSTTSSEKGKATNYLDLLFIHWILSHPTHGCDHTIYFNLIQDTVTTHLYSGYCDHFFPQP